MPKEENKCTCGRKVFCECNDTIQERKTFTPSPNTNKYKEFMKNAEDSDVHYKNKIDKKLLEDFSLDNKE